ncbi:MAG: hypothetical protein AAFO96_29160, partial [Bacteroidota bacterium]
MGKHFSTWFWNISTIFDIMVRCSSCLIKHHKDANPHHIFNWDFLQLRPSENKNSLTIFEVISFLFRIETFLVRININKMSNVNKLVNHYVLIVLFLISMVDLLGQSVDYRAYQNFDTSGV